ncbi:MAG: ABC transporter ATP-binding protein [Pseudorhodobacter sp. PARRP1]|nr:MAG: ABC transporter ATP-binding protein [Pseudorhodobacter sp. PARRP1]
MSLLSVQSLTAHYGDMQALYGVDFGIDAGQVAAVIGPNGAGKTTLMRAMLGAGARTAGRIEFAGQPILGLPPEAIAALGIAMVPEGRRLFASLSVEENLRMGESAGRKGVWTLARVFDLFPILKERRHRPATALSGGQQQMVAVGRALMTNPKILLCDELSLGLSPLVVEDIYALFPAILAEGMALVIVEQDVGRALKVATSVTCLMEGRVVLQGAPGDLSVDRIAQAYFGAAA